MVRKKYDGERMYFSKIMKSWEAVVRRVLSPAGCRVSPSASPSLLSLSCCPRRRMRLGVRRRDPPPCHLPAVRHWMGQQLCRVALTLSFRQTWYHYYALGCRSEIMGAEVLPASGAGVLGFLALLLTSCQSGQNRWLQIVSKFSWCVA